MYMPLLCLKTIMIRHNLGHFNLYVIINTYSTDSMYLFFLQKQDVKDNSIQKRLSWNYGQHIPNNELSLQQQSRLPVGGSTVAGGRNGTNKCLSNESMHSSSGVSSTGIK